MLSNPYVYSVFFSFALGVLVVVVVTFGVFVVVVVISGVVVVVVVTAGVVSSFLATLVLLPFS